MDLIKGAIKQEILQQLVSCVLLLVCSGSLLLVFFKNNIILTILGLIGVVVSLHLIHRTFALLNVQNHRLIQLLHQKPGEIVWVYSVKTERLPFGFQWSTNITLYFKLSDGDEISIVLPRNKIKLISKYLNRLLPHATFGYSADRAQWYNVSPDLLRKQK